MMNTGESTLKFTSKEVEMANGASFVQNKPISPSFDRVDSGIDHLIGTEHLDVEKNKDVMSLSECMWKVTDSFIEAGGWEETKKDIHEHESAYLQWGNFIGELARRAENGDEQTKNILNEILLRVSDRVAHKCNSDKEKDREFAQRVLNPEGRIVTPLFIIEKGKIAFVRFKEKSERSNPEGKYRAEAVSSPIEIQKAVVGSEVELFPKDPKKIENRKGRNHQRKVAKAWKTVMWTTIGLGGAMSLSAIALYLAGCIGVPVVVPPVVEPIGNGTPVPGETPFATPSPTVEMSGLLTIAEKARFKSILDSIGASNPELRARECQIVPDSNNLEDKDKNFDYPGQSLQYFVVYKLDGKFQVSVSPINWKEYVNNGAFMVCLDFNPAFTPQDRMGTALTKFLKGLDDARIDYDIIIPEPNSNPDFVSDQWNYGEIFNLSLLNISQLESGYKLMDECGDTCFIVDSQGKVIYTSIHEAQEAQTAGSVYPMLKFYINSSTRDAALAKIKASQPTQVVTQGAPLSPAEGENISEKSQTIATQISQYILPDTGADRNAGPKIIESLFSEINSGKLVTLASVSNLADTLGHPIMLDANYVPNGTVELPTVCMTKAQNDLWEHERIMAYFYTEDTIVFQYLDGLPTEQKTVQFSTFFAGYYNIIPRTQNSVFSLIGTFTPESIQAAFTRPGCQNQALTKISDFGLIAVPQGYTWEQLIAYASERAPLVHSTNDYYTFLTYFERASSADIYPINR
ncbi:hypothetical protein M0R04_03760 [Candidatus Dojkabacteria bacterium]|jgi:hypothetical protein|nr:hypothetical protein [Candidatus Dojkabacteria bacterium]